MPSKNSKAFYFQDILSLKDREMETGDENGVFYLVGRSRSQFHNYRHRFDESLNTVTYVWRDSMPSNTVDDNHSVLKAKGRGWWVLATPEETLPKWQAHADLWQALLIAKSQQLNYVGPNGGYSLEGLTDTAFLSPQVDEILTFDGSNWINADSIKVSSLQLTPGGNPPPEIATFRERDGDIEVYVGAGFWTSITQGSGSAVAHSHVVNDITDFAISWSLITNKPALFPAQYHTHGIAEIEGFDGLDEKADRFHPHELTDIFDLLPALNGKAAVIHYHDDLYLPVTYLPDYSALVNLPADFNPAPHTHILDDIIDAAIEISAIANSIVKRGNNGEIKAVTLKLSSDTTDLGNGVIQFTGSDLRAKINNAWYSLIAGGSGGTAGDWADVGNKPTTFPTDPPSSTLASPATLLKRKTDGSGELTTLKLINSPGLGEENELRAYNNDIWAFLLGQWRSLTGNNATVYDSMTRTLSGVSETLTNITNPSVLITQGTVVVTDSGGSLTLPLISHWGDRFLSWEQIATVSTVTIDATNGTCIVKYLE